MTHKFIAIGDSLYTIFRPGNSGELENGISEILEAAQVHRFGEHREEVTALLKEPSDKFIPKYNSDRG